MESKTGTIRIITLTTEDVDTAIKNFVEKHHEPIIVFPDNYSIKKYINQEEISKLVKIVVELRYHDTVKHNA